MKTLEEFKAAQTEALLSGDEEKIRAFCWEWNNTEMPQDKLVFWGTVHKAITGCTRFPIEKRRESKAWLEQHGLRSFDDGDL